MEQTQQHITLSQLQSRIKDGIDAAMPLPIWVSAEISELKVNYSGHCYMELVEKGGSNQVPKAKINAVIWRSAFGAISSYFSATTGKNLAIGMKILMKVSANYHELYGLSLVVLDIDPLYTLGDMEQQRQQIIAQLQKDGVYDMNRSLEIPPILQRIAVVSSRNAAGYQDFINELGRSGYHFHITLFDAFMQGNEAENSIVDALVRVAENDNEFDIAVVIRGGGSQSDLACFNSYRLCAHIAQMPLPVITGIGHDKDQSIADLVSAVALKTPTAVATYLVDNLTEVDNYLNTLSNSLLQSTVELLDNHKRKIQDNGQILMQVCTALTRKLELKLVNISSELTRKSGTLLMSRSNNVDSLKQLLNQHVNTLINNNKNKINLSESLIQSRRPESILSLGFAIVRHGGSALKSSTEINIGSNIDVTLYEGSLSAEVKNIKKSK